MNPLNLKDNEYKELIRILIQEGVLPADILWWHGLSQIEKENIQRINLNSKIMVTRALVEKRHLSPAQVMFEIRKTFPSYANYPLNQEEKELWRDVAKDDYPLPYELHDRVDKFMINMPSKRRGDFVIQDKIFSTMNAHIRHLIRNKEL